MALRAASSSGRAKFTVLWAGLDGQVKKYGAHSVGPVSTRPHHAALRGVAGGGWLSTSTSPPFSARWPLLSDAGSSSSTSRNPPARGSPKILPNSPTPPRRRVRSHGPLQEVGRQLPRYSPESASAVARRDEIGLYIAGAGVPAGQRRHARGDPAPPAAAPVLPPPRLPRLQALAPPRLRPQVPPPLPRSPPDASPARLLLRKLHPTHLCVYAGPAEPHPFCALFPAAAYRQELDIPWLTPWPSCFLNEDRMEAVVWEPVTRSQHRIAFPPEVEFDVNHYIFNGVVLSASSDYGDGHVHNDLPFKLVLLFNSVEENLVCACVYEPESGKWGNISSIATPTRSYLFGPGVLVRNALYWFLGLDGGSDILEFDLDTQSLAIIHKPPDAHFTEDSWFRVLSTKDRGLCLAIVSTLSIQLWGYIHDSTGIATVQETFRSRRQLVDHCQLSIQKFLYCSWCWEYWS